MEVKIIRLIRTRHDYDSAVEKTIIGIVNVDEDITELIDVYHENCRRIWDSENTPEEYKGMCEEEITTEIVKISTVQGLVSQYKADLQELRFGAGEEFIE